MGLKVTTDEKGVKVIRKDKVSQAGKNYTTYSLMVSSKDMDDNWTNGFIDCQFKKGVEVGNKAVIKINNAFYTVNEYNDKKYVKIFVLDFETLTPGENANASSDGFMSIPAGLEDFMKIDDSVFEETPFK